MLEWTDERPPNESVRYNHVIAETPLGQIILEWKGWKTGESTCGEMPWGEFIIGFDLPEAKANAQAAWDAMVPKLAALCSQPN